MDIIREKIAQVPAILNEFDIDLWLIFVRETRLQADPIMPLLVGHDVTWQSFFAFTRDGKSTALVGNFDEEIFTRADLYNDVRIYTEGVGESIQRLLSELKPKSIAVNYSPNDPAADGLSHGMFLLLEGYLKGTRFAGKLVSAESICAALRSRKTASEIELLSQAANMSDDIWSEVALEIEPGMSERDIGAMIDERIVGRGGELAFVTAVNAGDKTRPGHGAPTDAKVSEGDLVHVDFGMSWQNYCADLQRLVYFPPKGKSSVPDELSEAFELVGSIITETGKMCKPGALGFEIDALAREMLTENGYPVYEHALGHQLGRSVHDGGAIIGPKWERYGRTPMIPMEESNLFTLELEINLPGIGCVGLEEDTCVTPNGAEFLCPRQQELLVR